MLVCHPTPPSGRGCGEHSQHEAMRRLASPTDAPARPLGRSLLCRPYATPEPPPPPRSPSGCSGPLRQDQNVPRSEEHTSELQSLMRISYAVFCLKKKIKHTRNTSNK